MKRFIEGEDRGQSTLLPEHLDDYVADDNPVRVVDVFVSMGEGHRSTRHRRHGDTCRRTLSRLEVAAELRLGEKRARQAKNLVRLAQLAHFSLERLNALLFGTG